MKTSTKQQKEKFKSLQREHKLNLVKLHVDKMNENAQFGIENFLRNLRPFFKTSQINQIFTLSLHGCGTGIKGTVLESSPTGLFLIHVISSKHQSKCDFKFHVQSHKDFLQKLIKHDLI